MHGLDVVAVRIVDKGGVVSGMVLAPESGTMFLHTPSRHRRSEEGVHRLPAVSHEGHVHGRRGPFAGLALVDGEVLRSFSTEGHALLLLVHGLKPERPQSCRVEGPAGPEVSNHEEDVINDGGMNDGHEWVLLVNDAGETSRLNTRAG